METERIQKARQAAQGRLLDLIEWLRHPRAPMGTPDERREVARVAEALEDVAQDLLLSVDPNVG